MKKNILLGVICMVMIFLSSCSIPYTKPQGSWKSDDPDLVITFPEISNEESPDSGTMKLNGETEDIYCLFGYDPVVEIFPFSANHKGGISDDTCYFKGMISWDDGKLLLEIFNSCLDDIPNDTTITFSPQEGATTL